MFRPCIFAISILGNIALIGNAYDQIQYTYFSVNCIVAVHLSFNVF